MSGAVAEVSGAVVLVAPVGSAAGSRAAAAALACAGSEPDRAGLLVDLTAGRAPRPTLAASAAARELEGRLVAHLPEAGVASRGWTCHLALPPDRAGLEAVAAALPIVRDSVAVVHLPPSLFRHALEEPRLRAGAVMLRADLDCSRSLAALAVRDLLARDLRVVVLKHPLGWLAGRCALAGIPSRAAVAPLPKRLLQRLEGQPADTVLV